MREKACPKSPFDHFPADHGYTVEGTKNFHAHRVLVSIGGPAEVAAESALARAISRSSAGTIFYTSDGPSLAENQAAERARIANTGRLVIDVFADDGQVYPQIGNLIGVQVTDSNGATFVANLPFFLMSP